MADFKKTKSRNIRKRRKSSESDSDSCEEDSVGTKIQDIKELQKLRNKQNGVNATALALGKKISKEQALSNSDPFKLETGGMVDMKALKKKKLSTEEVEAIGTAFAAETNRRDEDTEMLKYVEVELARRKGHHKEETPVKGPSKEDALYSLPENLKVGSSSKKTEDMLSNQMLSGIPEIDLGIEAKIANIETTEIAKQKLLIENMRKKEHEVSAFVPTNMAANFVQHNRFNIEDTAPILKKPEEAPKPEPVRVGDVDKLKKVEKGSKGTEKATDDFHYEKFKKQMRRY
ncbi:splicing factor C9orf78 homolog [Saccostrea echinata]|uniref:splicing factor C9orf78 homolog n=1 Tax=Saccostrea echinata TaxID=191078 RepID=UPI002A80FFAD|nr:splicing factor C9orf78 homolog [Saccostrea echinata]